MYRSAHLYRSADHPKFSVAAQIAETCSQCSTKQRHFNFDFASMLHTDINMDEFPTPPDTISVRKALIKHREELLSMKMSAYADSNDDSPTNYDSFKAHRPSSGNYISPEVARAVGFRTQDVSTARSNNLMDLILYRNPAFSFLAIIGGSFAFTTARYVISGPHELTFLSAISYLLLLELAINSGRTIFAANPTSGTWTGTTIVSRAVTAATKAIDFMASLHDNYLLAQDPKLSLKVGGSLWALAVVGRYLSAWTMFGLAGVIAFTVPYLVHNNWEIVSALYCQYSNLAVQRYHALGLTRKQRAGAALSLLFCVWMRSSWTTRFIGMFVAAMVVRCNLKPAEVEAIREHAAPLTLSVKKRAARFSLAATDFATRTLGNKTHRY